CSASTETQAAAGAAAMVTATGLNRAMTGECWAACTPGYVCEHDTGLCVPGECSPSCKEEQLCVQLEEQLTCIEKSVAYNQNLKGKGPYFPVGGPARPSSVAGSTS